MQKQELNQHAKWLGYKIKDPCFLCFRLIPCESYSFAIYIYVIESSRHLTDMNLYAGYIGTCYRFERLFTVVW